VGTADEIRAVNRSPGTVAAASAVY
jgi:hypothetical protein